MNLEFIASTQFLSLYTYNVVHIDLPMSWKLQNRYEGMCCILNPRGRRARGVASMTVHASHAFQTPMTAPCDQVSRAISIALNLAFFPRDACIRGTAPSLPPSFHPSYPSPLRKFVRVEKNLVAPGIDDDELTSSTVGLRQMSRLPTRLMVSQAQRPCQGTRHYRPLHVIQRIIVSIGPPCPRVLDQAPASSEPDLVVYYSKWAYEGCLIPVYLVNPSCT